MTPPAPERKASRGRASKKRKGALFAVWSLEILLTLVLIAFVAHFLGHRPFVAATVLIVGTFTFSVICYVLLNQEILERMKMLKSGLSAEQEARNAAEELAEEKSRLLATMSHEIRTPLNGVIGMLGLLLESELTPEQKNYAGTAHASGRILLSIIDEILDGAKSEALSKDKYAPVDIVALVENVTELLAPRAHAKGIEIVSLFAPDVPQMVRGDDMRLRQILFNLAGNAIKFTEQGGVAIAVARGSGDDLVFTVSDTGIGMTPDELQRVFRPYTQANAETTRRYGGTGLGLTISRRIAEGLGGSISAESTKGKGTALTVVLPHMLDATAPLRAGNALAGRRFRLSLSSGFVADHFARQLQAQGATIAPAAATESDAKALLTNSIDPIICDAASGPDLLEAARRMARQGRPVPQIWILLSPDERRQLRHLLTPPLTGYLMRPVRCSTLVEQLTSRDSAFIRTAAAQLRTITTRAGSSRPLNVLLADDTPVNTVIARTILEKAGHKVTAVSSGAAAIEAINSQPAFDILLLDMEMPGLSGPETARLIRAAETQKGASARRLPILALTANTRPEAVEACSAAGMDGHLAKPFDRHDLENCVARLALAPAA